MRPRIPARQIGVAVTAAALVATSAVSAEPRGTVSLRVTTSGGGVVRSADGRVRCGSRCTVSYRRGRLVTLRASPGSSLSFEQWRGGCVGSAPSCVLVLDRSTEVEALFVPRRVTVAAVVGGPGMIVSSPAGIVCGRTAGGCSASFGAGTPLTLTAIAGPGAGFAGWGGACASAAGRSCSLTVGGPSQVRAVFAHGAAAPGGQTLSVSVAGPALASAPAGIRCPSSCSAQFGSGTRVALTGRGNYVWRDGCVGSGAACELVVDASTHVSATAAASPRKCCAVNVTVAGGGVVKAAGKIRCGGSLGTLLDCNALYRKGSVALLRALPPRGTRFVRWSGSCRGRKTRCRLRVNAPKTVEAVFRRR